MIHKPNTRAKSLTTVKIDHGGYSFFKKTAAADVTKDNPYLLVLHLGRLNLHHERLTLSM